MSKTILSISLVVFAVAPVRADDADPKKLASQVEKLMEAYNKDDVKTFFANWAKVVESITNAQTYDSLYKNAAKKELGKYTPKSVKFRKDGSVLTGDYLVVHFEAEFEKSKTGQITVNFAKEGNDYKFMQVKFEKKK